MSPLQQAQQWLADQAPGKEEIQQSIDNLCHQYARPPNGLGHEDIYAAISYLMDAIGGDLSELVLPDKVSAAAIDLGPLGLAVPSIEVPVDESIAKRRERFESLKEALKAQF